MFRWFETRIATFPDAPPVRPPETLLAFYSHFVRPIWPVFAFLLVAGLLGSLIEVALLAFVGSLVDMMRSAQSPAQFFADHGTILLVMAFIGLVARPAVSTAHELIKNQIIAAPVSTRIRWLTHRYVLRQSLGFFQNDFAGRVANKIIQTGPALRDSVVQVIDAVWYAVVQWIGAAVVFAVADWRLLIPLVAWLALYIGALIVFVPRIKERSTAASEARSMLVGRIVDSYTNILTVKLFAHAEREDAYARAALQEQIEKWQASLRLVTVMDLVLYSLNGLLMVSASGMAIWLWAQDAVSIGAIAAVMSLVLRIIGMSGWILWVVAGIFENIGVVQEGMETISRANQVVDKADSNALRVTKGDIRFEHVEFHYGQAPVGAGTARRGGVIHDLSLHIRAGEKVGLVGRSGAGKSTLVNLLLRFYDLESGRILIDGQDIAAVTQDSLAGADRHGDAGHLAPAPLGARQHPLRPSRCRRGGGRCRGQEGAGARLHPGALGPAGEEGLRRARGRARREALGRPAPEDCDRARASEERADPGAGRGHQRPGFGGRGGDPGAALQPDGRQDRDRHRPPAVDDRGHGPADHPRQGPHRRGGHARVPAAAGRRVRRPVGAPVRRVPGRGGGGGGVRLRRWWRRSRAPSSPDVVPP